MSTSENTGADLDRRDFMRAGTIATAAALGGSATASAQQTPANPLSILKNLRILDLSVALEHDAPGELSPPQIEYSDHESGGKNMQAIFGCGPEDLSYSHGHGWAVEKLTTRATQLLTLTLLIITELPPKESPRAESMRCPSSGASALV